MANDDKLKILGQTAADVPEATTKLVDEVATEITSLEQTFSEDLFVLSDKQWSYLEVVTRIRDFITQDYGELQEDINDVVGALEEMGEAMSDGSQELFNEYDKLISEVNELGTYLSQETARVSTSMDEMQRVREELDQVLKVRMPTLTDAYQELFEKYPEVGQALETLISEHGEQVSALSTGVPEQTEKFDGDLTVLQEKISSVASTLREEIDTAFFKEAYVLESLGTEGKEVIQERLLKDTIVKFEDLKSLIKSHDEAIEELMDNTSKVRSLSQPALDQIQAISEVLEGLIDKVKEVAQTFSSSL
jgi:uncharacterized phage infection (PIP) family protein YhgE